MLFFPTNLGSERKLKEKIACLIVRTRGWHLDEGHIICDGLPMSGALVDFGLYFYHNIHVRMARGSSTYYYLPKMETYLECRLWNQVFQAAEDYMEIPQGTFLSFLTHAIILLYMHVPLFVDLETVVGGTTGVTQGMHSHKKILDKPKAPL